MAGGRQAVVVRIHHAITDGLGALNMFLLLTSDTPAGPIPISPRSTFVESVSTDTLRGAALRAMPSSTGRFAHLLVDGLASHRRARSFRREHPDLPRFVGASRLFTNRGGSGERLCASHELDLDLLRTVAKTASVTINGAYHALIAASMRDELLARREDASTPTVAAFGIAADPSDSGRVHGNHITPTTVKMFSNIANPVERLRQTARSCKAGVELRKVTGLEMAARWSEYTCRLAAFVSRHGADRLPRVPNHVTTANVAGPKQRRFAGVVEVVDWISFALSIHPANVNITAYSYAGRLSIGLVTTPGALPDPRRFLLRMEAELAILATQLGVAEPDEVAKGGDGASPRDHGQLATGSAGDRS
jgi:hypothetical protein